MKKSLTSLGLATALSLTLAACGGSNAGETVRAVGSSTVMPFAKLVAEAFAKDNAGFKTPIVEGNGTGGGMKLFCKGAGAEHPDVVDASRRMKKSEYEDCQKNGVKDIAEVQIGIDGIVFANAKGGAAMALTPVDVYKAIAANPFGKPNTAKSWKDVNPALPDMPILVYGPATISGTRDALKELILGKGCDSDAAIKALKDSDKEKHDKICGDLRTDGAYVDTSDNYNLIIQKLAGNDKAVGIFGFSYLEANVDKVKSLTMSGKTPTYESISDFSYPGARPLYIYVKKANVGKTKGLKEYVGTWPKLWGKDGALAKAGMIVMPEELLAKNAKAAAELPVMDASGLK